MTMMELNQRDNGAALNRIAAATSAHRVAASAQPDLIAQVVHELRSPMTGIQGYADLLAMGAIGGPLNAEQIEAIHAIGQLTSHMAALVNDLSDVAAIEAGHVRVRATSMLLLPIINNALQTIQPQIVQRHQTITVHIPDAMPPVFADPMRLLQIVNNLLSNASKYTPHGGQIMLRAIHPTDHTTGREMICLTVQDDGIGIHPDEQSHLFKKFFRSADRKAREVHGTGLGLVITKYLVEAQGGRIWIESEYRAGTTVYVTLPSATSTAE